MSDFLTRLVERTQGVAQVAQPIIPPMFAPMSTTMSDYAQNSVRDSELLNAPNRAIVTPPLDYSNSAKLSQSFHKTSNTIFVPTKYIESALSEQVEAVFLQEINDQIEHSIIEHSSNLVSSKDLTNSKQQKKNSFNNNESPSNRTVSEHDQNTSLLPEQSLGAKKDVFGGFIDSGQVNVPQNLPDAERDQNISPQHEHSLDEKQNVSGRLIAIDQASTLRGITESNHDHIISLQSEHSLNEKREASVEPIYSDKASVLREITEFTGIKPAETSYLKPHSFGKIRFQQAAEPEPSSAEPTIKVIIGRVEVRAIMPSAPIAPAPRTRSPSPILSLDDYLKKRNEGQR